MKSTLILFILFQSLVFAQCDTLNVVKFPDAEARFPGEPRDLLTFVQANFDYDEMNKCLRESSLRTYVTFIVCQDGQICNVSTLKPHNIEFDRLGRELVKKMPNWIPGEVDDQPVASLVRFPLTICLR